MGQRPWWRWGVLVGTVAGVAAVQVLGPRVFGPGADAAERFPPPGSLFTPAGWAFSIWGPIYLGFVALAVAQVLPRTAGLPLMGRVRGLLLVSAVLNAVWMFSVWRGWLVLSVALIAGMLALAVRMLVRFGAPAPGPTRLERALRVPFSLYAGWLTVAAVANVSATLVARGFGGWGIPAPTWAVGLVLVATAIGLAARFRLHDRVYGAVFVWALVAIALEQRATPAVAFTAGATALSFLGALLVKDPSPPGRGTG